MEAPYASIFGGDVYKRLDRFLFVKGKIHEYLYIPKLAKFQFEPPVK